MKDTGANRSGAFAQLHQETELSSNAKAVPPQIPDHEVIRRIGGGSYGDVWLGRNVVGTYRAIKIIHQARFSDCRPFEREFMGMKKFEPISRTHPGFVGILQIGRNESAGYFYYIMELAEDLVSGQVIRAETYTPRTLHRELANGKRLTVAECLQLGLSLTDALENLHKHGLVHRDIKPSNIIFFGGVPKLADIGLVTAIADTASTIAGTPGYIPFQHPGHPSADLYSLGKVLYETCTGKDCQQFPDLPTDLEQPGAGAQFRKLNEILLKACENNPRHRYQSAREMHADLWRCAQSLKPCSQPYAPLPQNGAIPKSNEKERKLLTVLCVNAAVVEKIDPEDAQLFMQRFLQAIRPAIERYKGTITQVSSDGVMAIFGAPVASEDHAKRGLHAALAVKRALDGLRKEIEKTFRSAFEERICMNSGLAVAGAGTDGQYAATGDSINLASRAVHLADPGQILITEDSYKAVKDYFFARSVGQKLIQGRTRSLNFYEVTGAQSPQNRLEASVAAGLTPFVGREHELTLLDDRLGEAKNGRGQVVSLAGEPGVGKSRLLLQFRSSNAEEVTWLAGRSLSFGHEIAYLPIIDLLKSLLEIQETDDEAVVAGRLERGLNAMGEEMRFALPFLRYLFGVGAPEPSIVEMEAQQRRLMIFDVLRKLILKRSHSSPLVVVIEDLHWVDKTSEDFLVSLAESLSMARVLLLLSYRSSYRNPFPELSYITRLMLQQLSTDESVKLARNVLAGAELPPELLNLIASKAEGNPFFVEEMIKSLIETGALVRQNGRYQTTASLPELHVPETIQDVIMSRIDHLEPPAKRALQLASVIGREFAVPLLETIADLDEPLIESLKKLKHLELIYERSLFPEHTCIFKHALTQDVAYNSLLIQRRKELHCLVAAAIEELYASSLPDFYGLLAYHYEKGEEWERALDCLVHAAEASQRVGAHREEASLLSRAMAIAQRLGKTNLASDLRGRRGSAWVRAGMWAQAKPELEAALAELPPGRSERRAELLSDLAGACFWNLDAASAQRYGTEGYAEAQKAGRTDLIAGLEAWLAGTKQAAGQVKLATKLLRRAAARAAGCVSAPHALYLINLYLRGRIDEAVVCGRQALQLYQALGDSFAATFGQSHLGLSLAAKGQYREAIQVFEQARQTALKHEIWSFHARAIAISAGFHLDVFDLEGGEAIALEAREFGRSAGFRPSVVSAGVDLVFNFTRRGQIAKAEQLLAETDAEAVQIGGWHGWLWRLRLTQARAELALACNRSRDALGHAQASVAESRARGRVKYQVAGLTARGQALISLGHTAEGIVDLRRAVRLAKAIGDPAMLLRCCSNLLEVQGSDSLLAEARAIAKRIYQELPVGDLRCRFAAAEPICRLGNFQSFGAGDLK